MKLRPLLSALLVAVAPAAFAAQPVLIDFGSASKTTKTADNLHWNNVTERNQHDMRDTALNDVQGAPSGIALTVVSPFNGTNTNGTTNAVPDYPASATGDSLYGNVETFNNRENITPVLKLSGLNPENHYNLTFYASRLSAGDDRTTLYTLAGAATTVAELNVADNETATATAKAVAPAADGTLTLTITAGPTNNNRNHFTYLGVLQIDQQP